MEAKKIGMLVDELSATELVLGQMICNRYRENRWINLAAIVKRWIAQSGKITEKEWLIGTRSLISYCSVSTEKDAHIAIAMLTPPEQCFKKNKVIFREQGRLRGKLTNPEVFDQASVALLSRVTVVPLTDSNVGRKHETDAN